MVSPGEVLSKHPLNRCPLSVFFQSSAIALFYFPLHLLSSQLGSAIEANRFIHSSTKGLIRAYRVPVTLPSAFQRHRQAPTHPAGGDVFMTATLLRGVLSNRRSPPTSHSSAPLWDSLLLSGPAPPAPGTHSTHHPVLQSFTWTGNCSSLPNGRHGRIVCGGE